MSEESEKKPAEEKKKTKTKASPLFIALSGQLLLMLGAAGLLIKVGLFSPKPDLRVESLKEKAIESVRDENSKIEVVDYEEFIVNLPEHHTLKTHLQFEVSNNEVSQKLLKLRPVIRSRIIDLLSSQHADLADRLDAKLLLKDILREALNAEIDQEEKEAKKGSESEIRAPASAAENILKGVVREVYFVDFILI